MREPAQAGFSVLARVALHQVGSQPVFRMGSDLAHCPTGVNACHVCAPLLAPLPLCYREESVAPLPVGRKPLRGKVSIPVKRAGRSLRRH